MHTTGAITSVTSHKTGQFSSWCFNGNKGRFPFWRLQTIMGQEGETDEEKEQIQKQIDGTAARIQGGLEDHFKDYHALTDKNIFAAMARALANDPPIIVADEPTGNLDTKTEESIFSLFEQLTAEGKTMLMVTHSRRLAALIPRQIEISDGVIARDERRVIKAD